MKTLVRFAPSPTGYLHVGNVRTALINWLFARKAGGEFILRMDDTDAERSKPEYEAAIREDLQWLGLQWAKEVKQSDRLSSYEGAQHKLREMGRLYACYETQDELDIRRKMMAGRGLPPIYDRAALNPTAEDKKRWEGRQPHYRFKLEHKDIRWDDLIRGASHYHGSHLSDPVLVREDGVPLYTFASVVDDGEMGITHILRGEDHVTNTAVQIQIFEALSYTPPAMGHMALIRTKEGELSKRTGGGDIRSLRETGIEPMAINSLLAKLGTSDPVEAFASLETLVESFDITKFGRAPANYDEEELKRLNAKLLHHMPYEAVKLHLKQLGLAGVDESFWLAVRGNVTSVADVGQWWNMIQPVEPVVEDSQFAAQAAALLPQGQWDDSTWNKWIEAVKAQTGRKGKELFMPLRKALTGREDGPELRVLLLLIGREKALKRLHGEAA